MKLIKQLREQTSSLGVSTGIGGRSLREITLNDPIRYGSGDGVESWLNNLLCLDATVVKSIQSGCPHPSECELFYVNRDTLFSYHKASEAFLQRMMALYVSSHYKNSPNLLKLFRGDFKLLETKKIGKELAENTTKLAKVLFLAFLSPC